MGSVKRIAGAMMRAVRHDRRFQISTLLGLLFGAFNFWLLRHLAHLGYNKFLVNLLISLTMAAVWYGINRFLWKDRKVNTRRAQRGSTAWWAFTFGAHQLVFGLAIAVVGIPLVWTKGLQYGLAVPEFCAKYQANDKLFFAGEGRDEDNKVPDAD